MVTNICDLCTWSMDEICTTIYLFKKKKKWMKELTLFTHTYLSKPPFSSQKRVKKKKKNGERKSTKQYSV